MTARDAQPRYVARAHPSTTGLVDLPYGYRRVESFEYHCAYVAWAYLGWQGYDPQAGSRWRGWFEGGTELATDFGRFRWRGRFMLEER